VIIAIAFYLSANQSSVASGGLAGEHAASGAAGPTLIWNNLLQLPSLWAGVLGTWGLGWLDALMPASVWVFGILAFGAATFTGLTSITVRKIVALAGMGLLLVAIPSWILYKGHATVGQEVQPRYIMPLVIIFAGIALLQAGPRLIRFTRVQTLVVIVAVAAANAIALHTTMARYISGPGMQSFNLNHFVRWWWDTPVSPMIIWVVGSVAFAAAVAIALWQARARLTPDEPVAGGRPSVAAV
jgi:drug/metabolite transporter (DMT)-like permease